MIYAVMGAGPRTGTSFVMRRLHEAGLPVYWDEKPELPIGGNPSGYFETDWHRLSTLDQVIVKVWPRFAHQVEIDRLLILRRDRDTQVKSLTRQLGRERHLWQGVPWSAGHIIDYALKGLSKVTALQRMEFRTETLDQNINQIIDYLSVPFKHRRVA